MDLGGLLYAAHRKTLFLYFFAYSAVSILVLWDLLLPGYILTLDMIFSPNIKIDNLIYGLTDMPVYGGWTLLFLILDGASQIMPVWAVQKIILFLILFLSGTSAFYLCPADNNVGRFFAGLLYMLNPFVYVRFMAGHWLLLLAFAITPFAIKFMIDFLNRPGFNAAVKLAFLLTLVALFNSHVLLLNLFVFLVFFIAKSIRRKNFIRLLIWTIGCLTFFLLLNIYWILPTLLFIGKTILAEISYQDLIVFTAKNWGTGPNILFSLASMHGFWRGGYRYISDILPGWYLLFAFILFLAVYGFLAKHSDKKIGVYVKGFAAIAIFSLILSAGISSPLFAEFFEWLFKNLIFMKAFRDSQKFIALLALVYAYLGGLGVASIVSEVKKRRFVKIRLVSTVLVGLALSSPFIYSLNMLGGFSGELNAVDYPDSWYEVNDFMNSQPGDFKVLFFPWHAYMDFSWSGRRLSNPALGFFDKDIIQGENIEVIGIETQSGKPAQKYIHFLLENRNRISNLGELLAPLNVKYILLAKEVDYRDYSFLYEQEDLKLILDYPDMAVFLNEHWTSKFYIVREIITINDWNELLERSKNENIMDAAYLIGHNGQVESKPSEGHIAPDYIKISPAKYNVQMSSTGFLVFASFYEESWKANNSAGITNIGITIAYQDIGKTDVHDEDNHVIVYNKKFDLLLLSYLVSIISF